MCVCARACVCASVCACVYVSETPFGKYGTNTNITLSVFQNPVVYWLILCAIVTQLQHVRISKTYYLK